VQTVCTRRWFAPAGAVNGTGLSALPGANRLHQRVVCTCPRCQRGRVRRAAGCKPFAPAWFAPAGAVNGTALGALPGANPSACTWWGATEAARSASPPLLVQLRLDRADVAAGAFGANPASVVPVVGLDDVRGPFRRWIAVFDGISDPAADRARFLHQFIQPSRARQSSGPAGTRGLRALRASQRHRAFRGFRSGPPRRPPRRGGRQLFLLGRGGDEFGQSAACRRRTSGQARRLHALAGAGQLLTARAGRNRAATAPPANGTAR
jgi:hypothetical protein